MSEKELKELDKEVVGRLLSEVKDFLLLSFSDIQTAELIESNQLFIALRFLKSTYLEKRLKGLNDIKHLIERIDAGIKHS
jgi:ubiquitin carboxyl-terminal hydrolase 9/24